MYLLKKNNYKKLKEGIINAAPLEKYGLEHIGFDILKLEKGNSIELKKEGIETVLVLFSGEFSIDYIDFEYNEVFKRTDLFKDNTSAVYIPGGGKYKVIAKENVEIGLCYANTSSNKKAFIIKPKDVKEKIVGKDNYKRIVKDIIKSTDDTDKFIIGETISENGNWSSFPPHKHDRDIPEIETKLEEIYFFRFQPSYGFAIQKIYTEDFEIDETFTVEDYDSVIIPRGYHPVVGCPGYKTYYFWILGGSNKNNYQVFEDKKYSWINK